MNIKTKMSSMLDTTKKKAGVALLAAVLVGTIGAGAAFAANSSQSLQVKTDGSVETREVGHTSFSVGTDNGKGGGLLSKVEDGVRTYSTDGGKTWTEQAPDGVTVNEDADGKFTMMNGISPEGAEGSSLMVKVENGVTYYSTDEGKTWSDKAPDGVATGADGEVTFTHQAAGH